MPALEEKKIVISLPRFDRSMFLNPRFALAMCSLFCLGGISYWYVAIHPYLKLDSAHVETFSLSIGSDITGRITETGPQDGDKVRKGDLLFAFDSDALSTKKKQLKSSIESAHQQLQAEKMRMEKAMEQYLAANGEVGLSILEEAQAKSESAASQLAALESEFLLLQSQEKKMVFAAPFDGIVLRKCKNAGAVLPFGEPVYVLADPNQIWIEAALPEKDLSRVSVGTPARVKIAAYPDQEWTGQVSWIGPATVAKAADLPFSGANVEIPIKITLEQGASSLKPGLSASVDLKVR
ncbi:MAG: hypothetical protein A3E80_01010 [Chlamydiae bacterium RIFCSPHIGHO2_12_FULL_49_9]|nr:MAG: hypothetical protein A3E80_01010 [Chlamydiae bacterium RIFCSPHIGHO2_12_FULL_49_9]